MGCFRLKENLRVLYLQSSKTLESLKFGSRSYNEVFDKNSNYQNAIELSEVKILDYNFSTPETVFFWRNFEGIDANCLKLFSFEGGHHLQADQIFQEYNTAIRIFPQLESEVGNRVEEVFEYLMGGETFPSCLKADIQSESSFLIFNSARGTKAKEMYKSTLIEIFKCKKKFFAEINECLNIEILKNLHDKCMVIHYERFPEQRPMPRKIKRIQCSDSDSES